MRTLPILLLLGGAAFSQAQLADPPRTLYDTAIRDEDQGKFARARLVFQTLANTYRDSPLAARAKTEVDALDLFQEALVKLRTGHSDTAFVTIRTVAQVYPESPLAKQAEVVSRVVDPEATAPVVRSIEFRGLWPVSQAEIRTRFTEREVALAVERAYDADEVNRAGKILLQLLTEKGHAGLKVTSEAEVIPPRSVRVTFTVEKQ